MPLGKLVKTVREIIVYKKTTNDWLGETVEEINVDELSLEVLKTIVTPNDGDPFLYDGYVLDNEQLNALGELLGKRIVADHEKFDYCLECYGIFEDGE